VLVVVAPTYVPSGYFALMCVDNTIDAAAPVNLVAPGNGTLLLGQFAYNQPVDTEFYFDDVSLH
jgi:hypothetical protein